MWKFQDFSVTKILLEINFGDSKSAKSAIFPILKTLNFPFYDFFTFLRLDFTKLSKFRARKMAKTSVLELLDPPILYDTPASETSQNELICDNLCFRKILQFLLHEANTKNFCHIVNCLLKSSGVWICS